MADIPLRDDAPRGESGPGRPEQGGPRWLSRLAALGLSFLQVVGMGGLGLLGGLAYGAWQASRQAAALPPPPVPPLPAPGFAPAVDQDWEIVGIWFGNLVVNGIIGLVAGLALGVLIVLGVALSRILRARRSALQ